ncbi:MAG: hypothetical protein AAFN92_18930, partial [Bacteroidota bacterium]
MTKYFPLFLALVLTSGGLFGQTTEQVRENANRANDPTAYPVGNLPATEAMQDFDASFPEQDVGFLHV